MRNPKVLLALLLLGAGLLVGWDELVVNFYGKPLDATTFQAPSNGNVPQYVSATGKWTAQAITIAAGDIDELIRLEELSDVATMTEAAGDLIQRNAGNTAWDKLAIGATGTFLTSNGSAASWNAVAAGDVDELIKLEELSDVATMTEATGDIIYRTGGGVWDRLAIGSAGQVLTVAGGLPSWAAAGAGSTVIVQESDVTVDAAAGTFDFAGANFDVTTSPAGEVNVFLATDGVTPSSIAAAAVGASEIADGVVTGGTAGAGVHIAANTITAANIATGGVATDEILDGTITGGTAGAGVDIAANTITAANIATDGVAADEIAASAVGTSEVNDNTLTTDDLAANSVDTSEIVGGAPGATGAELADSVTNITGNTTLSLVGAGTGGVSVGTEAFSFANLSGVAGADAKGDIPVRDTVGGTAIYRSLAAGGAGTALCGNGAAAVPTYQSVGKVIAIQSFTGSGTYTPRTGMIYCIIESFGGGGGGGAVDGLANACMCAAGGGAGGYSRKVASAADIGASQTVTIGAGGAGGTGAGGDGSAGGDTSVGALCIGKGGSGGVGQTNSIGSASGGAGGVAGTGGVTATGARGGNGANVQALSIYLGGGNGGDSPVGTGGLGGRPLAAATSAGAAAAGYASGGGGAGAQNTTTDADGGAGTAGLVIVTEFASQ